MPDATTGAFPAVGAGVHPIVISTGLANVAAASAVATKTFVAIDGDMVGVVKGATNVGATIGTYALPNFVPLTTVSQYSTVRVTVRDTPVGLGFRLGVVTGIAGGNYVIFWTDFIGEGAQKTAYAVTGFFPSTMVVLGVYETSPIAPGAYAYAKVDIDACTLDDADVRPTADHIGGTVARVDALDPLSQGRALLHLFESYLKTPLRSGLAADGGLITAMFAPVGAAIAAGTASPFGAFIAAELASGNAGRVARVCDLAFDLNFWLSARVTTDANAQSVMRRLYCEFFHLIELFAPLLLIDPMYSAAFGC
jgi:hypothetical protein